MQSGAHRGCRKGRAWTLRQLKISAPEQASGIWEECCRLATASLGLSGRVRVLGRLAPGLDVLDGPFPSGRPASGALEGGGVPFGRERSQEGPADLVGVDEG